MEFYRNKDDARTARGLLAQLKEANANLPDDSDDGDDHRTTRSQVSAMSYPKTAYYRVLGF